MIGKDREVLNMIDKAVGQYYDLETIVGNNNLNYISFSPHYLKQCKLKKYQYAKLVNINGLGIGQVHFITEDRNKAKAQKEYQTRGTKKYTKEGIIDRLSAKPYNFSLIAPRKSSRDGVNLTGDERSYYYGYYTLGTEKIAIQLKYPDVKRMATIEEIGYNDAKSGISLADLPKEIKENREYLLGYKKALEELLNNNKNLRK